MKEGIPKKQDVIELLAKVRPCIGLGYVCSY
jgi:hypothetical protein